MFKSLKNLLFRSSPKSPARKKSFQPMLECLEQREMMAANIVLVRPITANLTSNIALLQATQQSAQIISVVKQTADRLGAAKGPAAEPVSSTHAKPILAITSMVPIVLTNTALLRAALLRATQPSLQIGSPLENGRPQPANGPVIASQTPLEKPYKPVTDVLRVPAGGHLDGFVASLPAGTSLDSNGRIPKTGAMRLPGGLSWDSAGNIQVTPNSSGQSTSSFMESFNQSMGAIVDDMQALHGNNTTRTEQQSFPWGAFAEVGKAALAGLAAFAAVKADSATKPENTEQDALNIELTKLQIEKTILEIEKLEREAQEADDTKQKNRSVIDLGTILYIYGRNGTPDPNREYLPPTPGQLAAMEAHLAQRKEKMIGQPDENKRPHQKPIMNAARPGSPGLGNLINPGPEGGSVATGAATVKTGTVENAAKKLLVGPSNPDEPTGNGSGRPTPPREPTGNGSGGTTPPRPTQSGDSGAPKK